MTDIGKIPSFFQGGATVPDAKLSKSYKRIRDDPEESAERELIEAMWRAFAPYCGDPVASFLGDARQNFAARLWEMRLAAILLDAGYELRKPPRDGPDLGVKRGDTTLWIEAVAVEPGNGPDAVPPLPTEGHVFSLNRDKILLRYTSALLDKKRQQDAFVRRQSIEHSDAYIVAINAGAIDGASFDRSLPEILRAVYPIGDPVWLIPPASADEVRTEYPHRPQIPRANDRDGIPSFAFLDAFFNGVSALIFAPGRPIETTADDLIVVHNAVARGPVPHGFLAFGREYGVAKNEEGRDFIGLLKDHHKSKQIE